jgi:ribonuclease HI
MQPPQSRKDVQKLTCRIALLNQFISMLAECSLPFFTVLRGSAKIVWGVEQQKAFESLKSHLEKLPTLSSPERGQPLIIYVLATHVAVSGALVVDKEIVRSGKAMKQQFPVYFVSEVLTGSKRFYSEMEKNCYAIVMSARKVRHYFEAHTIKVLTNQPLNDIFGNRESSRRISKLSMEHSEHVVHFEKRSAVKSQILADFVAKWMEPGSAVEGAVPESPWLICCDGAWGVAGARAAAILTSPSGFKLCYVARLQFNNEADKCTNNIAEYEAILLGLQKLRAISVQRCILHTDSKVVVGQIEKECITREPTLKRYLALVRRMEKFFKGFTVEYIDRNKNTEADELVKAAAHNTPLPPDVFLQIISDTPIKTVEPVPRVINIIQSEDS